MIAVLASWDGGFFSGLLVGNDEQVYMIMISVKAFETGYALIKHHQNAVKWKRMI